MEHLQGAVGQTDWFFCVDSTPYERNIETTCRIKQCRLVHLTASYFLLHISYCCFLSMEIGSLLLWHSSVPVLGIVRLELTINVIYLHMHKPVDSGLNCTWAFILIISQHVTQKAIGNIKAWLLSEALNIMFQMHGPLGCPILWTIRMVNSDIKHCIIINNTKMFAEVPLRQIPPNPNQKCGWRSLVLLEQWRFKPMTHLLLPGGYTMTVKRIKLCVMLL